MDTTDRWRSCCVDTDRPEHGAISVVSMGAVSARHRAILVPLFTVATLACEAGVESVTCADLAGTWEAELASLSGHRLSGSVVLGPGASVHLTSTSRDGARAPMTYEIDSLTIIADSIAFSFAPLGIQVKGSCVRSDSIAATFVFPQPPFEPITGEGYLRRTVR